MSKHSAEGLASRIGKWAAALELGDIPERVRERIRLQIATSVTAAAASPWHETARAVAAALDRPGEAQVFATGEKRHAEDAAYVNSAFAMSLDFDDYMLSGHAGHSAVLVPLSSARSFDEVIVAAAAADEVMGRLSTSCLFGPLNGQMTSYIHAAGAAIAQGRMIGLGAEEMAHAVALSLSQPPFCLVPGFFCEGSKTLTASTPQMIGVRAAKLAGAGVEGPLDLFEHRLGFFSVFSFRPFPGLFDGLGRVWFSETLSYKRFPGTSYISAAVEAALRLSGGQPIPLDEVDEVVVETTVLSATLDDIGSSVIERSPLDSNAVNFSLKLSLAAALRFGELTPARLRPESLAPAEGELRALAAKIRVVHDLAQSVRLFSASPLGMRMVLGVGASGWARQLSLLLKLRGQAPKGPSTVELSGLLAQGPALVKLVGPVTDLDFDPSRFRMFQSARVTLKARGRQETVEVEIPEGACGRAWSETTALVRARCERTFGERGQEVFSAITTTGAEVEELANAIGP